MRGSFLNDKKVFWLTLFSVAALSVFSMLLSTSAFTGPSSSAGVGSGVISSLNGNVGIGTATPSTLLHMSGTTPYFRFDCTAGSCGAFEMRVNTSGGSKYFAVYDVNNSTQPFTILNSGNIGIATTTPAYALSVAGTVYSSTGGFRFPDGTTQTTAASGGATVNASNVTAGVFASGNFSFPSSLGIATTTQVSLPQSLSVYGGGYFSGSVGIGTVSPGYKLHVAGDVGATAFYYTSDERLKTDIRPIAGLSVIDGLRGVTFTWKESGQGSAGLIAQEVETVLPEAVSTDLLTGLKSLNYAALTAPIVEAIKELKQESDEKSRRITELEQAIQELNSRLGK